MSFLETRTQDEQSRVLAGYIRNDELHASKNISGSNLKKVLVGLANQWNIFRNKIDEVYEECDPRETTALIEEWEGLVGIPDSCFSNTGSLEERRTNILLKLAGVNATTAKQFEDIARILGYIVTVNSAVDTSVFPLTLPFILVSEAEAPFTIVVTMDESLKPSGFPLTLPFTLTSESPEILKCLFSKLKPANTRVIFRYA